MPTREHTNTCNAVTSALENIRDLDEVEFARQSVDVQKVSKALAGWERGQELDDVVSTGRIYEIGREWGHIYVIDGTTYCDCDAKYVHVIARRWHRGHDTTAPARVLAHVAEGTYLVEFLTPGPGSAQQIAFRSVMAVSFDDAAYLDDMPIQYPDRVTVTHPSPAEVRDATRDVVDYLWEREEDDYNEGQHEGTHVFESLSLLRRSLDI